MRRGNLDKISYILIIISALFTVISYVSDQLVIKYENNLRLNKFNYQNLNTEIKSIKLISNTLSNLEIESNILVGNELRNKNFWIKHLILFESDKQKFVDHRKKLDIFIDDDFPIYNIKVRARSTTRDFVDNVVEIKNSYKNILNDSIFNSIKFYSKNTLIENLSGKDWFLKNQDKFYKIKNWDELDKILNNTKIDDLTLKNWFDIRNFRLLTSEILFKETKKLTPVIDHLNKITDDKIYDLDIIFFKQKKINTYKNYFILIGIISQILTLFFLLILFRYLIKKKIL